MRTAIVTGADHGYFPLLRDLLQSLQRAQIDGPHRLCVLDFGMTSDETADVTALGADVVRPTWWFDAPERLRIPRNLGYAARPVLPACLPGYDVYLWLDADITLTDGSVLTGFVQAAANGALAVAEEVDPAYRTELYALKWQIGNAFRCFGVLDGLRLCLGRPINSGVMALHKDAPHWHRWQKRYRHAVQRAGRANLDQHALMATLYLDKLPVHYMSSTCNWICARSEPLWDEERGLFCRPRAPFEPISVLHWAGRSKNGLEGLMPLSDPAGGRQLVRAEASTKLEEREVQGA